MTNPIDSEMYNDDGAVHNAVWGYIKYWTEHSVLIVQWDTYMTRSYGADLNIKWTNLNATKIIQMFAKDCVCKQKFTTYFVIH